MKMNYHQIRCEYCAARLFDTDTLAVEERVGQIIIQIKCWRCGAICTLYLRAHRPERRRGIMNTPKSDEGSSD